MPLAQRWVFVERDREPSQTKAHACTFVCMGRGLRVAVFALFGWIMSASACLKQQPGELGHLARASASERYVVPVGQSPVRGVATAPVTIVEFTDFQCGPCRYAAWALDQMRARYGEKVRVVFKNRPLDVGSVAGAAAELLLEARLEKGDDTFWSMHDRVWESYNDLSVSKLVLLGKDNDLSADRLKQLASGRVHSRALQQDLELADKLIIKATPQLFVNGRRIVGAPTPARLQAVVDEELTKTDALIAAGVAPEAVYDELQKGAKDAP